MATDAKPASPVPEDPPADDPMDAEPEGDQAEADAEGEEEEQEEEADEGEEPQPKKRGRRRRLPGEVRAPATPASERPSRERKTVERYAELTPRSTPAKKSAAILQGSGTKLKEIPNVSFKLSKRKADESLQSLHTVMFGRKSNVHFLKRNISQFSGFVWTENEDKQRTRIKDKLDKFNKEKLLDFCEILDVNVKVTSKKEEVSAKLLEFLESPCITRDVVLTDVKKGKKRARKSKASGQASTEGASGEKKRRKSRKQVVEAEKENDDEEDAGPAGSEDVPMGEDDDDSEGQEDAGSDEEPEETPAKKKSTEGKQGKKEAGSKAKENDASGKKALTKPAKAKPDVEPESKKAGKKASKSSTKETNTPVDKANKKVSKPKKDEKETQSNTKSRKKQGAKASSENKGKGKGSTDAGSAPTTKQLHAVVSDILKEVDFNTATLADILRKLGAHFKMDLMDRKSEVKRIIEEVINSMSDDEGEEENDEEGAEENGKKENSKEDPDEDEK